MTSLNITAPDHGKFSAYVAVPKKTPAPGVLVIQEIFGVNGVMRSLCDNLAAQGYVALCPDLFWRQEPGVDITDRTEAEWAKAFSLFQGFDIDRGVGDLKAALAVLRQHPACSGGAATIGYCLGGLLAYLMATRSDADCNVSYYGVGIEGRLAEAKSIATPTLLHVAEQDKFVSGEAQAAIAAAVGGHRLITLNRYPGVNHAFARPGGEHYDEASATLANSRSMEFLKHHLA